ncbi:hypothetical protein ACFYVL_13495 [Streptomyces sp. NPDC004111]|uniref:hypothetical protein n=1 Tax=Streptomyces sp. NPDC004111 TaxID=3364690 RepID=UPI0036CA4B1B
MPQLPPHSPLRGRPLRVAAGVVVLLALAGYVAAQYLGGKPADTRCVVRGGDGTQDSGARYELTAEQAANAAVISSVGTRRGMPERAVTIALATALQESALRNIRHGDRDSLGLFQQRPSQGWGTGDQILDPAYSAARFYQHLTEVPGYSRLPLTVAAQRVQRSGFPQAYAKHEPDAALLASALTGRTPASLSCDAANGAAEAGPGDPAKVRRELAKAFGEGVAPRIATAGSPVKDRAGDGAGGTNDKAGGGRAGAKVVVVPVTGAQVGVMADGGRGDGAGGRGEQRGWELAHWAMAHSADLRITRISYAGREWSAQRAKQGWQRTSAPTAPATTTEVHISTTN